RAGAGRRVRPRLLSARLWRRLFRPDLGGAIAKTAGDRYRLRIAGDRDDLSAALRRADGFDRHRDGNPPPLSSAAAPRPTTAARATAAAARCPARRRTCR